MSPRFSGRQYPGAMKDYRVKLREEADARQAKSDEKTARTFEAFLAIGATFREAIQPLMDAFTAVGKALAGKLEQTQDDFALAPGDWQVGGYTGNTPGHVFAGVLPVGMNNLDDVVPGDAAKLLPTTPEYVLSREEWAEVHRLAKYIGEEK